MILTKNDILDHIASGHIKIQPLTMSSVGTNSIDLHLGGSLAIYNTPDGVLDCKQPNDITRITIPEEGYILQPGKLYLASTLEYTETLLHVPQVTGKSSIGRLGINIHATAGFGDVGFCGYWTLEIFVVEPVKIYAGIPIGQIWYSEPKSVPEIKYMELGSSSYTDAHNPLPQPSRLYRKFQQTNS